MHEVNKTLKRLAVYYLLLAVGIIPCANIIPDRFPMRNVSSLYLITLSVCLILYYAYRLPRPNRLSVMMKAVSWMSLLLILLRGVKSLRRLCGCVRGLRRDLRGMRGQLLLRLQNLRRLQRRNRLPELQHVVRIMRQFRPVRDLPDLFGMRGHLHQLRRRLLGV